MAFDYAPMQAVASGLLARFGRSSIVRSPNVTSTDPAAGTVTTGAPVDTTVNAVLVSINEKNAPGMLIESGDKLAIMDGAIDIEDQFIQDSEIWQVVNVIEIKPGDTSLIWKAQVRR